MTLKDKKKFDEAVNYVHNNYCEIGGHEVMLLCDVAGLIEHLTGGKTSRDELAKWREAWKPKIINSQ